MRRPCDTTAGAAFFDPARHTSCRDHVSEIEKITCRMFVLLMLSKINLPGEWPTVHALTSGGIFSGLLGTVSMLLTGQWLAALNL